MEGLYREHPAGIFLLPALLARLGYPAEQAAYAINAGYQVLTLVLLTRLAAAVVPGVEARSLAWLLQLLPVAFTYRIRANQEQALLLGFAAALLGVERSRKQPAWGAVTIASLVALLLVKGVLAAFAATACALWLLLRRRGQEGSGSDRGAWVGLFSGLGAMAVTVVGYEVAYQSVTGQPFLSSYLARQLGAAGIPQSEAVLAQKAYNLVWYLGRVLWFPFPWSLAALGAGWRWRASLASLLRNRSVSGSERDPGALAGLAFALALSGLYVGCFSLSDRRADRYIFPVYFALGAAGAVATLRHSRSLRRAAGRLDSPGPLVPILVWLLVFALHLASGPLFHLPVLKLWPPSS
jgi:hypothetical protein